MLIGPYASVFSTYHGLTPADARMTAEETIMPLELRVQTLELACSAMWSLLKAQTGLTDERLAEEMRKIDEADGTVDGKITRPALICPVCGKRSLVRRAKTCTWCGADLGAKPL